MSFVSCICLLSILSSVWPCFIVVAKKMQNKHSPRKRQAGKNRTNLSKKQIFCRFRTWNRNFGSIYGSRDIEQSLYTTLIIFGQNLNFMDEYLENQIFSGYAVFAGFSYTHCIIDSSGKKLGSNGKISGTSPKSDEKWMNQIFFWKSGFVT